MISYTFAAEERADVRAMLRRHPGFEAFRQANGGFASRDMTSELIIRAITALGVESDVQAIMERHAARRAGTVDAVETGDTEMKAKAEAPEGEAPAGSTMVDSVLDPLRPFVSDKLLSAVQSALAPIVEAALKPAVEIERIVEIEVPVAANGSAVSRPVAKRLPAAKRAGASTFGKVFGAPRHAQASFPVALWDAADAPVRDPMYVIDPATLALLVTATERGGNVWLAGPAGGGKSSMPEQYAARTGRPFTAISFNRAVEATDLIGQYVLDGAGGMVWADGVLTQAIRRAGNVILLDEIMFAPAGMLALLQTLLSSRVLTIHATGERVSVADGVIFVCADNTRGYGDETGLYVGTVQGNAALIDRMARMLVVDYLPAELEAQALANHTGAPRPACDRVVAFIGGVRKLVGFENRPMSLRRMVAFVRAVDDGFRPDVAFDVTMLSRLPDAEREALRQHIRANFDAKAFDAEMSGAPVPVSVKPGESVPAGTFTPVE
jgi:cobaltochelatase CobS